jgi:2-dehydropantoate 2-reductase
MKDIFIVGTGALATLFAARLARAGTQVTMLGTWPAGLEALRSEGVRLVQADGNELQFGVHVVTDPRECQEIKYALVLVKAWQTERVAAQLKECLSEDGLAITLQNGLGNRERLVESLGPDRVALGTTTTGATLLGPGRVRAGGEGMISIGRHPALGPLTEALRSAGFPLQIVDDAQSLIWGKLVINAAINPLTALLRVQNGKILENPSSRELMAKLATEAAQAAGAENIHLPFPDPILAAEEVARKTAENYSSMLQDVLRGAPTEIDAICGGVVNIAQKHHFETPANWACWKLVKALTD